MSEENTQQVRIDPNEEITSEKKLILLNQWKDKVQNEIDEYNAEKERLFQIYKKQKDRFDKILAVKLKKIKKIETFANGRKKVLSEVIKEIDTLTNPPPA